jgi:hypothetical protein
MKQLNAVFSTILALVVLVASAFSCNGGQPEQQSTLIDQYYSVDPITLLASLKRSDLSGLVPVQDEPEPLPEGQQILVTWSQADYLSIANILREGLIGYSSYNWQLNSMDFRLSCTQVTNGFQNGRFTFFSVVKEQDQETRITSFIDIDPRGKFIHLVEEKYYPKLVDWKVIDVAGLKISADQALQIAEMNGGKDNREAVGNACYISLVLSPGPARNNGWIIRYTRSDEIASFFSIVIDPYTGEFRVP